ncbi:MAG: response regulator [bacterium]
MKQCTNKCCDLCIENKSQQIYTTIGKILENSLIPVFIYDPDSLKHVYINRGAQIHLDYSFEELENKTILEYLPDFSEITLLKEFLKPLYLEEKEHFSFETIQKQKNGKLSNVEIKMSFDSINNKKYLIALFQCIEERKQARVLKECSERKKMELEVLRSKDQAECANKTKSEFLAMMSHEIRTPINCIIGFLQLLENTQLHTIQKDYLKKIKISSNTLLSIINDILDFSKIEAGKLNIENIKFDLHSVLEESLSIASATADLKNLNLNCLIYPQVPKFVNGDSARLKQILNNLISNAIKFTEEGYIYIEARLKENINDNNLIEITVKDTGIGISAEKLESIFDPFTQADISTTRKFGGTGLGLAITKNLIEMMGGKIKINSSTKGTEAIFTLSLKPSAENKCVLSLLSKINIVIIEPDETNTRIIESYLNELNCQTQTVKNFEDGVRYLKNNKKTDFLIINYNTLCKNHDFISYLMTFNDKLSDLQIIAITTNVKNPEMILGERNFLGYLHKPIKKDVLQNYILNSITKIDNEPEEELLTKIDINDTHNELSKFKILIAEDNEINIQFAIEVLNHLGLNFDVARNGKETLNLCKTKTYDLILMDCQMPIMDGYEACSKIKELDNYKNTPIIAVTAYVLDTDRQKCLEAGMDDYISKPIDIKILVEKLRRYLLKKSTVIL